MPNELTFRYPGKGVRLSKLALKYPLLRSEDRDTNILSASVNVVPLRLTQIE